METEKFKTELRKLVNVAIFVWFKLYFSWSAYYVGFGEQS